jgi:uncharacterized protein
MMTWCENSGNARIGRGDRSPSWSTKQVDQWLAQPPVRVISDLPEQWQILKTLLASCGTAGNLTTDAYLASLAIAHGAVLVSCDTDFARFSKLRWEHPLGE